jgi:hypothetical protein
LQQTCVFKQVLDALLLVLHNNVVGLGLCHCHLIVAFLLLFASRRPLGRGVLLLALEGGGGLALVALLDVVVGIKHDHFLLAFYLDIWRLYGAIPALLALPLVQLAHRVDLTHHLAVNGDPLFRVELLLVQHAQVQHLVLDF